MADAIGSNPIGGDNIGGLSLNGAPTVGIPGVTDNPAIMGPVTNPSAGTQTSRYLTGNVPVSQGVDWANIINNKNPDGTPSVPAKPVYTGSTAKQATSTAQAKFQQVNNQIANYTGSSTGDTTGSGVPDRINGVSQKPGVPNSDGSAYGTKPGQSGYTSPNNPQQNNNQNDNQNTSTGPTPPDLNNIQISPGDQDQINSLKGMMATMDQASQNMITAMTNEYNTRIQAQMLTNSLKLSGTTTQNVAMGVDRYAPTVASSIFTAQEAANNRALASLEAEKYSSLVQAQQAQAQMDFESLDKIHSNYLAAEQKQRDILQKQYDNSITQQTNTREQRASDLDFATKTAENFAPGILKQLSTMTDQASKDSFIQNFATTHNIDQSTLSGVVQKYQDTQNQTMRTAMYSMLADNPRAGISMDDINNYNIGGVAAKVAAGPDFALLTAGKRADIADKLAQAAIAQAQVKMLNDPNSITSLAQSYLDTGTMPTLPNPLMSATVLSAARQLAPSYLPKGSIVAPDGLPKDIGQQGKDQVNAGVQMYSALQEMRTLISKVNTFPGGSQAYAAGQLVGLTPTEVVTFQNDANMIAQNYDVLKGGVRGGSSSSLLQTAARYVPQVGQLPKYNEAALNSLEKAIVLGTRDILNLNGAALNNMPIMTNDERTALVKQVTDQGHSLGYSDDQIKQSLAQYGL